MSARLMARFAGFLYLIVIIGGAFAEAFVRQHLIVHDDAAATAAGILANEPLYRLGFVADLVPLLCNVLLAAIFYHLFRPVNRSLARLVVFFSLIGTTIQAAALLFDLGPLLVLQNSQPLGAFSLPQLQALAYLCLRFQAHGYTIALLFFGGFGMAIGWLIFRSGFLPRLIGALMMIAGLCYFTNSLLTFIAPSLSSVLFLLPCLLGEGSLALWLFFVGLNEARWKALSGEA